MVGPQIQGWAKNGPINGDFHGNSEIIVSAYRDSKKNNTHNEKNQSFNNSYKVCKSILSLLLSEAFFIPKICLQFFVFLALHEHDNVGGNKGATDNHATKPLTSCTISR